MIQTRHFSSVWYEDDEAAELNYAEAVRFVIFPAGHEAADIVEPSKEAFDPPAMTFGADGKPSVLAFSIQLDEARAEWRRRTRP